MRALVVFALLLTACGGADPSTSSAPLESDAGHDARASAGDDAASSGDDAAAPEDASSEASAEAGGHDAGAHDASPPPPDAAPDAGSGLGWPGACAGCTTSSDCGPTSNGYLCPQACTNPPILQTDGGPSGCSDGLTSSGDWLYCCPKK